MGGPISWLRRKKSKADKGNQKRKSSGNVKGISSGTSSSLNHLRASDGSSLDVCKLKKGHSFAVKACNPVPETTASPYDMQKDIGSEASYEKYKDSTVQLKPSLNGRTSASKQDIKSATPAVRDKISAVDLMPSLDLNHSPEPPGIIKTEIPLLSKKFQVRNRYPSDFRIFRYNQNGISSPNTSPGSAETSGAGSPFSSPTSLIGLSGARKTHVQSRDTMGSPRTSIESTDSLSMELFESRVVRPFGRKFSSRGLFTAAQDQKKGKADSTKYIKTKDEVLVKKLDMVDPPIENKISDSKISPSQSAAKFTHDINQVNNLRVDDAVAEKEMLDSMQTDSNSQISPSTSPFSRSFVKLTDDGKRAKNFHVNDAATENDLLAPMQTDGHSQISPSTSPASESTVVDEASNEESKSEILGLVQTDGHSQDLPSTSPVTHYAVKLTDDKDQTTKMYVNDATTENEALELKQIGDHIQISPSTSSLSRSDAIRTHDSDLTDVFNVVDANSKKEMLKSVQTNDHNQTDGHCPSTSPLSKSELTLNKNQTKDLHKGDVATANEVLDTMQTNGQTQISQFTTSLFQSHASSEAQAELFPSHADESVELECTDSEISEFYEDIDVEALQDIEYIIDIYDSEDSEYVEERDEINIENDDVINISKVDASISLHHTKKDEQYTLEDKEIPVSKSMFQRGRLVDLESENDIPRKLKFRRERVMKNENGTKTYVGTRRLSVDNTNPTSANAQYADSYDSEDFEYSDGETDGSKAENSDAVSISRVETLKGKQYQRNDKLFSSRDDHLALKGKFSRVKIMDVQSENDVPKRLKFRRRRVVEDLDDAKPYVERTKLKKRETDGNTNTTSPGSDYSDSCYSEDSKEFNSGNDVVDISEADILEGKHHKNSRKGRQFTSEEYNPAYKCKFRRGRILDLQCEDDTSSKLKFRRGKVIENEDGTKTYVERIRLKRRDTDDNTNATSPDCEYIDSYYSEDSESETIEFNSENGDVASINNNVDILQGKNLRHPRKYKHFASEEDSPAYKCNFRRGRTMDLQNDDNVPKRLKFKRGRVIEKDDGTKIYIRRRRFKKKEIVNNVDTSSPDSHTVALRHQEMQDKKDELLLLNDVIEETITKLARSKKSKVKALVGAFETVISLQDDKTPPG